MNALRPNRSMPRSSVIPVLAYPDVSRAADWLCHTFGFVERLRIGDYRVQLVLGNGAVVIVAGQPPSDPADSIIVRVEDVDQHCTAAVAAGAQIVMQPTRFPYGERQYTAVDPAGRRWTFSQSVADVDPAQWGGELREGFESAEV